MIKSCRFYNIFNNNFLLRNTDKSNTMDVYLKPIKYSHYSHVIINTYIQHNNNVVYYPKKRSADSDAMQFILFLI